MSKLNHQKSPARNVQDIHKNSPNYQLIRLANVRQLGRLLQTISNPIFPGQLGSFEVQLNSFQTSQTLVKTDKYNASSFGLKFKQQKTQLQQVFNQMTNEYCTKISAQYINQKLSQNWLK